jgi:large subunit ribosomal protein L25
VVTHGKKDPVIAAVTEPKAEEEEVVAAPVVIAAPETKGKPKKNEKQNKK